MARTLLILAASVILAGLTGCASLMHERVPPLSPQQIVDMTKAEESTASIISRIKQSRTVYNLTASQYAQLSKAGVADAVLDYMQQTYFQEISHAACREAYYDLWFPGRSWYGHPWDGYPWSVYPMIIKY